MSLNTMIMNEYGTAVGININNSTVSGITFIGCGEINVSYVEQFTFENSSIRMSYLILYQISNATITNSTFLCKQGDCNDTHPAEPALVIERSFKTVYLLGSKEEQCSLISQLSPLITAHSKKM